MTMQMETEMLLEAWQKLVEFIPAKDKLDPPLFKIGFGSVNLFSSPFLANSSILGPPG